MNSGIRFSVALIVVVVVLLGLYYAGLEDADPQTDDGGTPPVEVAEAITTEPEPVRPTPPATERPATEPSTGRREPVVTEPVVPDDFDEFPAEIGTTEPGDETATPPATDAGEETMTDATEPVAEEIEPAGTDDTTTDGAEPVTEETVTADETDATSDVDAEETAEAVDPIDETPTETSTPPVAEQPDPAAPRTAPPGRRVADAGVGIHRLASVSSEGDLATAAMRAISEASEPGIILGPANTAWIPLAGSVDAALLQDAILGRVPGDDTRHVLVLTDRANSVDLAGRVSSTEIGGSDRAGGWRVQFRVTPESMESIRTTTRGMVDRPVAWIGGGRLIVVARPMIAINGRAAVPTTLTTEAAAQDLVSMLETARASAAPTSTSNGTGGAAARPGDGAVVVGAGSLPLDRYTEYVVKPGDNFESIALWWFGDRAKSSLIAEANPYEESSRLKVGQTLRLPPKDVVFEIPVPPADPVTGIRTYKVRSGDTLGKIAQRIYGKASAWPRIHEANRDKLGNDPGSIKVGMELVIP